MGVTTQAPNPAALNAQAANLVKAVAVKRTQQIYSKTHDPSTEPQVTINPRNVGLALGWYVHVAATMTNADGKGDASHIKATDFGPSNILSRVSLVDLENNERINCSGRYLELITSLKARRPFGSSLVSTVDDSPIAYGANWTVDAAPDVEDAGGPFVWHKWFWVPAAYSHNDLRGAMYLNVVNATAQLTLTFNPTPFATAPTDDTNYCGTGNTGSISSCKVTCYQVYYDQLPRDNGGNVILPMLDLATVYELKETVYTSLVVSTDNPFDVPNFRDFLSLTPVFFDGAARLTTNVNTWKLQTANFTNIWEKDPSLIALETRNHLGYDLPKGCFYFGSRNKPIATVQYGNVQLVLNPSVAGAGATVRLGYEDFAMKNVVTKAGSLR